jgi:hypothetical protein
VNDEIAGTRIPAPAWLFAAIQVVTVTWVLLPGGAWYPSAGAAVFWTAVWLLLAYGVVRGNKTTWIIALVIELLSVVAFIGLAPWPWESTVWISMVLGAASLAALLSSDVRRHVNRRGTPFDRDPSVELEIDTPPASRPSDEDGA